MSWYRPSSSGVPQAPVIGGATNLAAEEIRGIQQAPNAGEQVMKGLTLQSDWEEYKKKKKVAGTERANRWLDEELYNRLNPSNTAQGNQFNYYTDDVGFDFTDMGSKRKFTDENKQVLLEAYKNQISIEGGNFSIGDFEQKWRLSKAQEDMEILSEMYMDYKKGFVSSRDFNIAARNPNFLNFYKDLSDDAKERLKTDFSYDLAYETPMEALGRMPSRIAGAFKDEPVTTTGKTAAGIGLGYGGYRLADKFLYQKFASDPKAYTANISNAEDILKKANEKYSTSVGNRKDSWRYKSGPRKGHMYTIKDLRKGIAGDAGLKWVKLRDKRYKAVSEAQRALNALKAGRKPTLGNLPLRTAGSALSRLGSSELVQSSARFGRRVLPYSVGGHLGYMGGSGLAKAAGLGEVGQAVTGVASGVGGSVGLAKIVKKLSDPAVRTALKPLLKKHAPKLLLKLGASMAGYVGPQAAEPISTALGLAGTAWAAYDLIQLAKAVPDIAAILMD